jgi:hypothetical protein
MFFGDKSGSEQIVTKFSRADSITLLGIKIDSNVTELKSNFEKVKKTYKILLTFGHALS